ncbi:MAG: hypothetical protein IJ133_04625 [Clostridia bacterium]|nr:hypothetical protein [Clostridia bacterium]
MVIVNGTPILIAQAAERQQQAHDDMLWERIKHEIEQLQLEQEGVPMGNGDPPETLS